MRQPERAGRYRAGGGAQGTAEFCVVATYCAHFIRLSRNSLPSSLRSFNMVDETARRAEEMRRSERAGRYRAGGGTRGAAGGKRTSAHSSGPPWALT